ncbi:putative RNA methyltransferase [Nocardia concava]|uniref:putative RNA methyltransferase n=1 Tax=Nocardia concava TaxID=257281 RepID=UPI0002F596F7|nr:methyltransferase domain-containing protein [Nocardia concava]
MGNTGADAPHLDAVEPSPADRLIACADLLACPHCGHPLAAPVPDPTVGDTPPRARTLTCPTGHTFDLAKQGYITLLTGASTKMTGDTPAMLDARAAFQSAGHFAPIAEVVAAKVATAIVRRDMSRDPAVPYAAADPISRPAVDLDTAVFGAESQTAANAAENSSVTGRDIDPATPVSDTAAQLSGGASSEPDEAAPTRNHERRAGTTAPGRSVASIFEAQPPPPPREGDSADPVGGGDPGRRGPAASARRIGLRTGIATPGMSVVAPSVARLAAKLLTVTPTGTGAPRSTASATAVATRGRFGGTPDARANVTAAASNSIVPPGPAVVEIGAGTGYYLAAVLDAVLGARGIALDVSKAAARRAARAHPRAGSVMADAWRGLPIRDAAARVVVCVFAPRNADEVARVLGSGGWFIVVTPTPKHLGELIGPLGMVSVDAGKQDRLAGALGERFELMGRELVEYPMALNRADVAHVVGMGPSAFHAGDERVERIEALPDPMTVTASVVVATYRVR